VKLTEEGQQCVNLEEFINFINNSKNNDFNFILQIDLPFAINRFNITKELSE